MAELAFHQFICRTDNYGLLLHDNKSGATASIDAPDAAEIERQLDQKGWRLTHIFATHHHGDHVDGNLVLKKRYGCSITGPDAEASKIPGIDRRVAGGDHITWEGREILVMNCPGHTLGHIAYYMPSEEAVFAGDTLFSLGCGRVFEGTMEQMYSSVKQFAALPLATKLYCGHEYTQSNARFALAVEPGNTNLAQRAKEIDQLRAADAMTCPSTIGDELATNPFLRTDSAEIRKNFGLEFATDAEVFAELRTRKNSFR